MTETPDFTPPPAWTDEQLALRNRKLDYVVKTTFLELYGNGARTVLWRSSLSPSGVFLTQYEAKCINFNWGIPNDRFPAQA